MPSGSKKRKSSKKAKPQGSELETALEEAMGSNADEVGEAIPSPKGIEGDPEAMAERGLEGNEGHGEACQEDDAEPEAPKEDFQTDKAAPDHDIGGQGDPPSQVEPEPEVHGEVPQEGDAKSEASKEGSQIDEAAPDQAVGGQGDPPSQVEQEPEVHGEVPQEGDAKPEASEEDFHRDAAAPDEAVGDLGDPPSQFEPEPVVHEEVPQEGDVKPEAIKEDFQTDEAVLDGDISGQRDPPPQVEPEPEVSVVMLSETPELEGENTTQRETEPPEPQVDTSIGEVEAKTDAVPEETKPELESDATPVESEPVIPDASPDEVEPDADVGLDENESSKESAKLERKTECDAALIANNESGVDASSLEMELKTDATSPDIEPEIDNAPDELKREMDAPAQAELEIGEPLVDVKPEAGAAPYIEPETDGVPDEAPVEVELEMDGAPELEIGEPFIDVKPEADAAPYIELETSEALDEVPVEVEPETDGAPAEIKPEAHVQELETAAAGDIDPETEEAPRERELVTDAATTGAEAEMEEAQIEELEAAAPVDIEPETKEGPTDREVVTDSAPTDVEADAGESLAERELAIDATIADVEPETDAAPTDVEAEVGESVTERELATIDATATEVEPEMDAATADSRAETDTAQVKTDVFHDEIPPERDAASLENEMETDVAAHEFEPEAETAVLELGPPTEVSPVEIEPEVNLALDEPGQDEVSKTEFEAAPEAEPEVSPVEIDPEVNAVLDESERDEVSQAEVEATREAEPEVDALVEGQPEVGAEDFDNSAKVEAQMVPPEETEPEPKPVDHAKDTSLELLQVTEPESEAEASNEAKPEDEAYGTKTDQQDFVEGEVDAPLEIAPEPQVETTHEIELDAEPEAPLEAEPESVVEASTEVEPDEKGLIEMESDQQDFVVIEPDQSDVKEWDQQLQKQEGEAEIVDLDSSVSESNEPSESQPQVADASEGPAIEDEPHATAAFGEATSVHDSTATVSSSEASDNTDKERTAIEQELDESEGIPPSTTALEQEAIEGVSHNQDSVGDIEETRGTAVDSEQDTADELLAESKDISEEQERVVDVELDEDGTVLASSGNGGETEESREQEVAIELPLADVVDVEESAKEDISEQERAVDVWHGEDGAVLTSVGNGGEVEVSSEQELGVELPPADIVEEEFAEGLPPKDQELVAEQSQPLIVDEQDLRRGLGAAADEPSSGEFEQSLNAALPSLESKTTPDAPEPQDEAVTPANDEKVASEHECNFDAATGDLERDIEEEEAASSTVAEAGSVLNDFDERASCADELPSEFPSTDQDVDISDSREFDDNLYKEAPVSVETGLREQVDSESSPAEKADVDTVCRLEAISKQQEDQLEIAEAAKPAEGLHSVLGEEVPRDEQLPSLSQPEQVVQDSGEDEVHSSEGVLPANEEELRTAEEERAACEDTKLAATSSLGTSFPIIAGDELISKAFPYLENGQQSLSSSEAPSKDVLEHRDESGGVYHSEANNIDKAEILAMDSKELKEAKHNPFGGDVNNDGDEAPISEGRGEKGDRVFHQESTKQASVPVVIPAQDRALEHVVPKNAEPPSGGGVLKQRTNLLGCCGMLDLLLRKN